MLFQTRVAYHVLHSYILFVISKKNTGQAVKTSIEKITRTNKKMKGTKKRKFPIY